ncbi:nuclear transport factor 2 family protein [Longispora sp. K20-0274]|uniref:nuclear transport factor 2 family protein n=1 Tax=Longispora sp. K20-0274 TaxID=3088255 RepID=UPI00399BB5B5
MMVERLRDAINAHDIDAFTACFAPGYRSDQPAHPARAFLGAEQVRRNWSTFFREIPDLRAELIGSSAHDGVEWGEWHWAGTRLDGEPFAMRGVTVMGIVQDRVSWGRLYMEEVERSGEDIDRVVRGLTGAGEG